MPYKTPELNPSRTRIRIYIDEVISLICCQRKLTMIWGIETIEHSKRCREGIVGGSLHLPARLFRDWWEISFDSGRSWHRKDIACLAVIGLSLEKRFQVGLPINEALSKDAEESPAVGRGSSREIRNSSATGGAANRIPGL